MFRTALISAPIAAVEGVDVELEEEVTDAESPVSEGPDDADAAVWPVPEVAVLAASILSRPAVMVTGVKLLVSHTKTAVWM